MKTATIEISRQCIVIPHVSSLGEVIGEDDYFFTIRFVGNFVSSNYFDTHTEATAARDTLVLAIEDWYGDTNDTGTKP